MARLMSTKEYVNCLLDEYNRKVDPSHKTRSQKYQLLQEQEMTETRDKLTGKVYIQEARMVKYNRFITDSKKALLEECIYRTFDASLRKVNPAPTLESTCRALVDNFVNEQGVENLLRRFRTQSVFLSELALLVDKFHKKIVESCDKDNEETFKVDSNITDKFYEELDAINADEVIYSIRNRVSDSMNEFIDQNAADKIAIKDVLRDTKDQIDALKGAVPDEVRESYAYDAKRKVTEIRNKRPKTVISAMVESMLRKAYTDDNYRAIYFEGVEPNMNKIVEHCEIMYTFLETVTTAKMIDVNENYIREILSDIT